MPSPRMYRVSWLILPRSGVGEVTTPSKEKAEALRRAIAPARRPRLWAPTGALLK